tara:strand:- start:5138 stop:5716 length:579 start_codon:yes stop_codon:yes gene_type:complete
MTDIYIHIASLSAFFKKMCFGLTKDEEAINDAVQELMLYFLSMNPETLKAIYEKDGEDGIIRYGAVVLRRSLTSVRSPFYYKYKKYYKNLVGMTHQASSSSYDKIQDAYHTSIYNMADPDEDTGQDAKWEKLEKIDKIVDEMYWYDKKLFELYYTEKNTLDSLHKKTGISRNSLFTTIQKVRYIIKDKIKDE